MLGLTDTETIALLLSLKVAFWSVLVSLPFGVGCAFILARTRFPGLILLDGLVHLPLVMPPVVVGYLLLLLLGRNGLLGGALHDWLGLSFVFSWRGAAIASAVMAFPLLVRAIRLSVEAVDRRLETAARTLGAGSVRVFFTVTLPLILPGILAGLMLAFARSLGEFGATITFVSNIPGETQTLPLAVYAVIQTPNGEAAAARLVIISIVLALLALAASEVLARRLQRRLQS